MDTNDRILYQVAFKGVIDLAAAGTVEFDTDDYVAEVIDLTDAFFDALNTRTGGGDTGKSTRKSTRSSSRKDSTRRGSTKKSSSGNAPKNPDADASPAQIKFLKKLLKENDVEYDNDGFDLDGEEYWFDDFTMGSIQEPIEALKE